MKTTITIPKKILEEAMTLSSGKTENELILKALKAYVNSIKRQTLVTLKTTFDFDIDLDELRERKDVQL